MDHIDHSRHRLIYILQYLISYTDAEHTTSINILRNHLKTEYNIDVGRDAIRDDLQALMDTGLPVEKRLATQNRYHWNSVPFETAELKVLIDAVTASRFLTEGRSTQLTEKLLTLTSRYEAERLRRHIITEGRVTSGNERGYYIVDAINEAIEKDQRVRFQYTDYNINKVIENRHNGAWYSFSPYILLWDGDYYYTVGWCDSLALLTTEPAGAESKEARRKRSKEPETIALPFNPGIRTFRLDRIAQQPLLLDEPAVPAPEAFDPSIYRNSVFRMYGTDETVEVQLLCHRSTMRALIDRFGPGVSTQPVDEDHFRAAVTVCPSQTFYRWVFGWGWDGSIVIEGPEEVRRQYQKMLRKALREQRTV